MSVRIHAIAKEIKKTSKEVLEILADRGYELKSASSTIDNITAESLIDEFKLTGEQIDNADDKESDGKDLEKISTESSSAIPLVKSKEDLEREKKRKRGCRAGKAGLIINFQRWRCW